MSPEKDFRDIPVFDGHNDLLSRIFIDPEVNFFTGAKGKHISLGAMRQGGMVGGLFAIFIPPTTEEENTGQGEGGWKLPGPVAPDRGARVTAQQFSILSRLVEQSGGAVRLCRTAEEIESARAAGAIAAVGHIEGAEGISDSLEELDLYYAAGVRSIGPVWSRPNRFGYGVPIFLEGSPDTGPGLTDAGRRLVERCRELRLVVDLSHLSEKGFWDVARMADAPLVASHSNVWDLCGSSRNLTNSQLEAIGESDGLVGLNFGTLFLRGDGKLDENTDLTIMVDHLRRMVDIAGVDHVGFGSDFDGTTIPKGIGTAAGLPQLLSALRSAGFAPEEIRKIAYENWLSLLRRVWGR